MGKYNIEYWETDDPANISYHHTNTYTSVSIANILAQFKTVLLRKIHDERGNINLSKTKDSIVFEELQKNVCLAASESLMGAYKRDTILKKFLAPRNRRIYLK